MIDDFSILLSAFLCAFVIYRAVTLDRKTPLFTPIVRESETNDVEIAVRTQTWAPDWEREHMRDQSWSDL